MRSIAMLLLLLGVIGSTPAVALAAGGGEHHSPASADDDGDGVPNWLEITDDQQLLGLNWTAPAVSVSFHAVNFVIFCGIIVWAGRRPIGDAIANRAIDIRKQLTDSASMRDEARQRNDELGQRLDRIESEIAQMRTQAEADAAQEEARLIERAHTEADRIAQVAERSIRDEVVRARFALKRDAVSLAVELAEATLRERMSDEHQQRLARDFLDSIKNDGAPRV